MTILQELAKERDSILLAELAALTHDLGKLSQEFVKAKSKERQEDKSGSWKHELILRRVTRHLRGDNPPPGDQKEFLWAFLESRLGDLGEFRGKYDERYDNPAPIREHPVQARIGHFLADLPDGVITRDEQRRLSNVIRQYIQEQQVSDDILPQSFVAAAEYEWELFGEEVGFGDFIEEHGSPVQARSQTVGLLRSPSDWVASEADKGDAISHQALDKSYIATAFGYEPASARIRLEELHRERHQYGAALASILQRIKQQQENLGDGESLPPAFWTDLLYGEWEAETGERGKGLRALTEDAFRQALGETRRAANDVTLWDHAYSVASLYKAALAQKVVEGPWPDPNLVGWRFLRVGVDGLGFFGQAHHVTDILGRRQAIVDALDGVRQALEVEFPVGNEVYRDENGSVFVMPGLTGDAHRQLAAEVQDLVHSAFASSELGGELVPKLVWNDGEPVRKDMVAVFGALAAHKPDVPIRNPEAMQAWWSAPEAEHRETCTVCGVRPIGYGVAEYYGPSSSRVQYYRKAAEDRKVCGLCLRRRGKRAQAWAGGEDRSFSRTIWLDEVADDNGRFALVVGRFGLEGWLDGQLIHSMRVAPGVAKNPSPARVRRCWDTTRQFWLDLVEGRDGGRPELEAEDGVPERPFRLRISPAQVEGSLGDYHVYDWPLQGETSMSVVWVPGEQGQGYFLTTDNLWYLAGPEQLALPPEALKDPVILMHEFGRVLNGRRNTALQEPSGYGRPAETIARIRMPEDNGLHLVLEAYTPYIPILAEPAIFMVLVPASHALAVARVVKAKYDREMERVRDRLPLHLGLVFAPRRTPLAAVLDAGRGMLSMPHRWERWPVEVDGRRVCLGPEGHRFTWDYPACMGDGETPDTWYANLLAVDPKSKETLGLNDFAPLEALAGKAFVRPSYLDFEFLDTSARRFEIAYNPAVGSRVRRHTRPFLLTDLDHLEDIWGELGRLEKAQRHQLIATIEAGRETWYGHDRDGASQRDSVFRGFVRDTLAGAAWPPGRSWRALVEEGKGNDLEAAGVSGELADLAELHMYILKE